MEHLFQLGEAEEVGVLVQVAEGDGGAHVGDGLQREDVVAAEVVLNDGKEGRGPIRVDGARFRLPGRRRSAPALFTRAQPPRTSENPLKNAEVKKLGESHSHWWWESTKGTPRTTTV